MIRSGNAEIATNFPPNPEGEEGRGRHLRLRYDGRPGERHSAGCPDDLRTTFQKELFNENV